eukprot:scaffold10223_cov96-Skeletonema_dohrnii-CCMP3373.AAC.5
MLELCTVLVIPALYIWLMVGSCGVNDVDAMPTFLIFANLHNPNLGIHLCTFLADGCIKPAPSTT